MAPYWSEPSRGSWLGASSAETTKELASKVVAAVGKEPLRRIVLDSRGSVAAEFLRSCCCPPKSPHQLRPEPYAQKQGVLLAVRRGRVLALR
jgi:hypothetical protein